MAGGIRWAMSLGLLLIVIGIVLAILTDPHGASFAVIALSPEGQANG